MALFTVVQAHGQTHVAVGVAAGYGQSSYTTNMSVLGKYADSASPCRCPAYPDATGPSFVPIAVAAQLRMGDSTDLHWLFTGSLGLQVSTVSFAVRGDSLPYLDANGNVLYSVRAHQMSMARRSGTLELGVGAEVSGFSVRVLGRASYVYSAETTNNLMIVSPPEARFDPSEFGPSVEILEDGRTAVLERIPTNEHYQMLFDVGASLSYSFFANLASLPMVFTLQPYVFLPLTTVHVNYTTTERIQYGCALFVGVMF